MHCPKCHQTTLRKKEYASPYTCPDCGGIWVGQEQLPQFLATTAAQGLCSDNSENDSKTGLCPEGHGILIRAKVESDTPFYLERCSQCSGIWFDQGEWHKINAHNLADQLDQLWSRAWQRQQRQKQSREAYLTGNKEILGDEIFTPIMELAAKLKHCKDKGRALALLQQEIQQHQES